MQTNEDYLGQPNKIQKLNFMATDLMAEGFKPQVSNEDVMMSINDLKKLILN
jgi:hypothetical protein